jgi:cholesterol transport system auxiliary component
MMKNPSPQPLSRKGRGAKIGILGLLVAWLLVACSLPLKSDLPADQVYRLQPQVTATNPAPINLYLPKVEVSPELDNAHITLIKPPNQQDFIAASRWPDNLSSYLHGVILDALSGSGNFRSVSSQMPGREANYRLVLRVSAFQAEYPPGGKGAATVEVTLDAMLVRVQDQLLLGQHRYPVRRGNVPVSTGKIVEALDAALAEALGQVVTDIALDAR